MEEVTFVWILNIVAIILSLVALSVTVLGFLASLKFYRDGMDLQAAANNALTMIGEKTGLIQSQVDGMFSKTLDAALGQPGKVSEDLESLYEQLGIAHQTLGQMASEIEIGEKERQRLKEVVEKEIKLIHDRVKDTQESIGELSWSAFLDWLSSKNRAMANVLRDWPATVTEETVFLNEQEGMNAFVRAYLDDSKRRERLIGYIREFYGKKMKYVILDSPKKEGPTKGD